VIFRQRLKLHQQISSPFRAAFGNEPLAGTAVGGSGEQVLSTQPALRWGCWRALLGTGYSRSACASANNRLYLQVRVENPDERADPGVAGTFQHDESSGPVLTPAGNRERTVRAGAG